jgi:hypothetical protein
MTPEQFDPLAMLAALERNRVSYVIIGAFAGVIQGTDEITRGLDITPSPRPENLTRLAAALADLEPTAAPTPSDLATTPITRVDTPRGPLQIILQPAGTRGYDDLRRGASREPLGHGLRPQVAGVPDLIRSLEALDPTAHHNRIERLQRVAELSRGLTIDL